MHRVSDKHSNPLRTPAGSSSFSRRSVVRGGAGMVAGTGLANLPMGAASSVFPALSLQTEPIELTYWHGWTEQWEEMVQFVVDMFHAQQNRIRIKPQVVAYDQFLTKLTAAIAAGNPPDVVTLFGSTAIPTLANEDAIIPLNGLEGVDMAGIEAWMNPDILRLGEYQENLYGLSYWAGCYSLIYNTQHFTEVGLDPTVGPATIAELDSFAEQLTQRQENGNIERMGFLPSEGTFWLWGTVFGGNFFDYENLKVTANDPALIEALRWYQSYAEKYDPRKVAAFNEGLASERAAQQDPLLAGKFSIQAQGPWKLGDIKLFGEGFEYNVVPPPRATEGTPLSNWTWGDIQVIPKGSKDPSAAAEFVQFTAGVNDPEGYAKRVVWGDRPINIPVSAAVLENPAFQDVVNNYPGFQVFVDSLLNAERVGSPPVIPPAAFYEDRLSSAVEQVMLLQVEPEAALDQVTTEVQRELDR